MAHAVAHQGLSGGSYGNRRSKQHNRNFEAVFGLNNHSRRSGSRPPLRSQYSHGIPMGACAGQLSMSSGTYSDQSRDVSSVKCTQILGLRVVSAIAAITGVALIFFGLFLIPGHRILALCISGSFLVIAALLIWCALYVRSGTCCTKDSGSASLEGPPAEGQGATQRPARGSTEEGHVNLRVDIPPSTDVMTTHGPDTRTDQYPPSPPPNYHQIGRCASFPISGRSMNQSPSTPPPPYYEIT